jgi:hypothetical protein
MAESACRGARRIHSQRQYAGDEFFQMSAKANSSEEQNL